MGVRLVWRTEFDQDLDRICLLSGEKGVLVSTGRNARCLDEAGLQIWAVTLTGRVAGFGFSSQENVFFIAHEHGIRLVNRIGVTMRRVPLEAPPIDFSVSEIVAVVTESRVLAFSTDGRELWSTDFGGNSIASFRGRIFVGNMKRLVAYTRSGQQIAEMEVAERIIAISGGRDSLVVALPHRILFLTEDCELSHDRFLDDAVLGLSVDEFSAVLHHSKVALYDSDGEERWLLPGKVSQVSTKGKGIAIASGTDLLYYEEVGEKDVLFEIMCRGESRCGTFVSASYIRRCPKCRSERITARIVRKELD
ncbi:MAG: hypothetical protein ACE5QF_08480 [Thermoplasmata archaeon]